MRRGVAEIAAENRKLKKSLGMQGKAVGSDEEREQSQM